ncbi:hypothetical protein ASD62_03375 [Phycicoccus sp. Root563]|nr:hypothetical protein ASD62_03375 [Phycicoccus sp. Root563]
MKGARGTTMVAVGGLALPVTVAIGTGAMTAAGAVGAVLTALGVLFLPLVCLGFLMSLGRGGPLSFVGRVAGNVVRVGSGVAGSHRPRRGGPGRVLILEHDGRKSRVVVARPLDLPIGARVTVHGLSVAGHRHAWFVRVHGLDRHPLPARGVVLALVCLGTGTLLSTVLVIGSLAEVLA